MGETTLAEWGVEQPDSPDQTANKDDSTPDGNDVCSTCEDTTSDSQSTTTSESAEEDNDYPSKARRDELVSVGEIPDAEDETSIGGHALRHLSARLREIPFKERYPAWHGRLRSYNQSARTLGELDCGSHRPYHNDDKEYRAGEAFAEIHLHTDLAE